MCKEQKLEQTLSLRANLEVEEKEKLNNGGSQLKMKQNNFFCGRRSQAETKMDVDRGRRAWVKELIHGFG